MKEMKEMKKMKEIFLIFFIPFIPQLRNNGQKKFFQEISISRSCCDIHS
jgi:hypothetical protein